MVIQWDKQIRQYYIAIQQSRIQMQQLTELFAKAALSPMEFKQESKEQFFSTKKTNRRLKSSLCLSQPMLMHQQDHLNLNFSITSMPTEDNKNVQNKDLDSTFGEDISIAFKPKQPKRKMNSKIVHNNQYNNDQIKVSHNYAYVIASPNVSKEKQKNIASLSSSPKNIALSFSKKAKFTISIKDFVILGKIGEGTYSEVYKVIQKHSGFLCALKVMEKQKMFDLQVQQSIIRQLKIQTFIDHPNIAKLYGFFHDRKFIYLICQYATDKSLYDYLYQPKLKLKKGLTSNQASMFAKQICNALGYLHKHSIIHRDIKPENILLNMDNTIKICDFGWSVYNPNKQMRSTFCGTPLYLAPELINQSEYDQSVDIWAVGVLTYQMLTEQIPFKIAKAEDLHKILSEEVQFERIRNKTAVNFIQQAMEKDASKRIDISQLLQHPFVT